MNAAEAKNSGKSSNDLVAICRRNSVKFYRMYLVKSLRKMRKKTVIQNFKNLKSNFVRILETKIQKSGKKSRSDLWEK